MKKHRIRSARNICGGTKPHIFLEMKKNYWLEVKPGFTHKAIHSFLRKQNRERKIYLSYAERAFHIGIINDWNEAGYLS